MLKENFISDGKEISLHFDCKLHRIQKMEIIVEKNPVIIRLKEERQELEELVVVGNGTQKRKDITGSVASVPKANLSQVTSSADNLLRGAVAGVVVTQSSGHPSASSSVRIRGGSSITTGNEPLYIVDDILIYNDNSSSFTGVSFAGATVNVLSTINPADEIFKRRNNLF